MAAWSIVADPVRRIDTGRFNDARFVYVASFGAFTKASYSAPQTIKNELGHLAYILEGVRDLSSLRFLPARVEADGEVFEGRFLFGAVANATSIGGLIKLSPETVVLDDGRFELLLVPEPKSVAALNDMVKTLVLQDFSGSQGLILRHVSHVTVDTEEALAWSLDGEGTPPVAHVEIENLCRGLTVQL